MSVDLRLGDCLDILPTLADKSVDAIITDVPYGTTACKWDVIIPLDKMWEQVKRLCKGAFVTTASQPFTSVLIMSNLDWFKYEWIWSKQRPSNPMLAKKQALKVHENITVFGSGNYYPQGLMRTDKPRGGTNPSKTELGYGRYLTESYKQEFYNYPKSILEFGTDNSKNEHPTQKPVALYEYLIKTYTNEGDTVLDFCMGSGTTLVACVNTNRNGIGIEREQSYFEIAQRRIAEAQQQMVMPL